MKSAVFFHHIQEAAIQENISIDEMLGKVTEWGITAVEMDRDEIGETEEAIQRRKNLLDGHGLKVSGIYGHYSWQKNGHWTDRRRNRELEKIHLLQAKILQPAQIMPIPGFFEQQGGSGDERKRMIDGMRNFTERAGKQGTTVSIEDFDNELSPIATIEGMSSFADAIPDLKITLDTGNFFFSDQNVLKAEEHFTNRIVHVHLKDRKVIPADILGSMSEKERKKQGDSLDTVSGVPMFPCAVGDGCIPMEEVLRRLRERSYQGYLSIEHFGAPSYYEAIRRSAEWLNARIQIKN